MWLKLITESRKNVFGFIVVTIVTSISMHGWKVKNQFNNSNHAHSLEHKTVQAQVFEYAETIGWEIASRKET